MNQSLILIQQETNSVSATDAARELIEEALGIGALIGQVRNAAENDAAVKAQTALKTVEKQIETAYRAAKDPIVQLGRKLDITYRGLVQDLEHEYSRIGSLAAAFALAEKRRVAAEAIAQQKELERLEREKHAAIAATPDPVKQAQVLEDFSRKAAAQVPIAPAPVRATGQKVREEWMIETVDLIQFARWVLMSGRWDCLGLEVKKAAVKELLEGGMKDIPGLRCEKQGKATVILPKAQKEIQV